MKKNIFKAVIAVVFIVGAVVGFKLEANAKVSPASVYPTSDCDTYCPNAGLGCILHYMPSDVYVTCIDAHS